MKFDNLNDVFHNYELIYTSFILNEMSQRNDLLGKTFLWFVIMEIESVEDCVISNRVVVSLLEEWRNTI